MKTKRSWSNVRPSKLATRSVNPIRRLVEMMRDPNPTKPLISLSIGDPTVFGNLKPCEEITSAVVQSVLSMDHNGYAPSTGYEESREAVAQYASTQESPLTSQDVILTSGCSHALEMSILVLADTGQNILIPRPGFSIYRTLAEALGIECRSYDLNPNTGWQVDLPSLECQIDGRTAAIVVNNPSNPCGSVFSKRHLRQILEIAERHCVPIIADEIYEDFVFRDETFYPIASLTQEVPVLACGGLTKKFMVPGWRMGWILVHDRQDIFGDKIRNGLQSLSQRIIGSNTLVQGALPAILAGTPDCFYEHNIELVQKNAVLAHSLLNSIAGLRPIMPSGAMYMMVGIESSAFTSLKHDTDFVERLLAEQAVFCLPGQCFDYPNYFRIVLTVPEDMLVEACDRIREFCNNYYTFSTSTSAANAEMLLKSQLQMLQV